MSEPNPSKADDVARRKRVQAGLSGVIFTASNLRDQLCYFDAWTAEEISLIHSLISLCISDLNDVRRDYIPKPE